MVDFWCLYFSGAFQLYDTDKSDSISKDEMHKIVTVRDTKHVYTQTTKVFCKNNLKSSKSDIFNG